MSAKADKGDRKREIEQSPMKKKFRDSAISSEDLDNAIANSIELAFKEQQSTLNSVVNSAVRDAMDSVLIPALRELREDIQATNKSVKELREEFEAIATETKQTRDRVDSVQADAREDRRTVTDLKNQLERLTEKMTDVEDRCRRNNVRLVGLPEGMEGPDAAGFLRANLSKWIPSLRGRDIEIDRAHRVYDRTIFCCSVRPMFSVMCGLSCSLFMVVSCSYFMLFLFVTTDIYTSIYFTLFLKGFFI